MPKRRRGEVDLARIAVVTGGAQGIGLAIVERLLRDSCNVVSVDVNSETLNGVYENLSATYAGQIQIQVADVSSVENVNRLSASVQNNYGEVGILVNNVGILPRTEFDDISLSEWDHVLAVNLRSMFLCTQAFYPLMALHGWGRIVNIGSMAPRSGGEAAAAHYTASKGGVIALTKHLARLLGSKGITVNAVCPGIIVSKMTESLSVNARERFLNEIPLRRMGSPDDVADVVGFLSGDDSRYVTGATIDVNGGYYMQ